MRASFLMVIMWFLLISFSIINKYLQKSTDYFDILLYSTFFLLFLDRWLCSKIIKEKEKEITELKNKLENMGSEKN
jgi:hypothetical protein